MKSTEDTTPIQRYTVQEQLQQQIVQLNAELSRLQTRLEECENERDELAKKRKDDSFECSIMSAITGRENGETLTMAVDRTCRELDKANQDLTALRALVAKKDEALKTCLEMFREIRGDWTDPRMECRAGADAAVAALALTPADCAGMAVVPVGELAELRRDKERLDWLLSDFNNLCALYDRWPKDGTGMVDTAEDRELIDRDIAARSAGGNAT